jgi:hypothetical protein
MNVRHSVLAGMWHDGWAIVEMAEVLGTTKQAVYTLACRLRRDGVDLPHRVGDRPRGAANVRFNGGLHHRRSDGRWVINCRDGSLMLYYRGVVAAHIGRLLEPTEIVHHINGDPGDDRIENLEIVTRAAHIEMHRAELLAARAA